MNTLKQLDNRIKKIEDRNKQVELNKAWETSWTRKITIAVLTYIVILLFFKIAGVEKPLLNAIVPTLGFLLSTLSLGLFKKLWIRVNK
jgi:hypothetical protein